MQQGWVSLLEQRLATEGYGYRVVNASVSGETTQGGLARLPRALETHKPAIVIVELGGNDGLRGLPLAASRENLAKIIELARAAKARVVLVGMMIPPNYGPRYGEEFRDMFATLADKYSLAFVPFLLDQVALKPGPDAGRRHSSQCRGAAADARKPLAGAQTAASCSRQTRKLACDTLVEGTSWKNIGSSRIRRAFALRSMSTSTPRSRR